MKPLILPPALRPGDEIRLVAPAGPFDRERFQRGKELLRSAGFTPVHRADVLDSRGYLAGDDTRRLQELQQAFDDPEVRAVWSIRGGYGSMRIMDRLDTSGILAKPKVFVGFSDLTAIHSMLNQAGLVTVHGPMVARLALCEADATSSLWRLLMQPDPPPPVEWEPPRIIREGTCSGPLLGGNLSLITRLLGTPFQPDLKGAVLLLEEVGELPYRVDRMLTHLELAGVPSMVSGVLVGDMTGCEAEGADYTCLDVVEERLSRWGVPVACGFPVGHGERNLPVPLGAPVRFDGTRGRLTFESAAVAAP